MSSSPSRPSSPRRNETDEPPNVAVQQPLPIDDQKKSDSYSGPTITTQTASQPSVRSTSQTDGQQIVEVQTMPGRDRPRSYRLEHATNAPWEWEGFSLHAKAIAPQQIRGRVR